VFEPEEFVSWQAVSEDLPSILLKGISKDLPWPGARCGWMEFINCQHSEELTELQKVLEKKKMLEVCATTLPQLVIPKLFSDPRLLPWYEESNRF
jgi:aspartate/methionine/tyrosine aminotransferase